MVRTRGGGMAIGLWCGAAAVLAGSATAVWAQDGAEAPIKANVLVLERPSLEQWIVDPKDKNLAAALGMIPTRIRELPHEFPQMPAEAAGVINLVLSTIAKPASLVVTYDSDNPEGIAFGYGLTIGVDMPEGEATKTHAQINGMIAAAGPGAPIQPSERFQGMTELTTPIGPVSFGPRKGARGWRYEVLVGHVSDPDAGLNTLPAAPAGLTPTLRGRFDFAGLTPVMSMAEMFAGGGDPGAAFMFDGMKAAGMWGDDAIKINFVAGHTADRGLLTVVCEGAKRYAEAWHTSTEPLSAGDLAVVPSDAVWAGVGKGDFAWLQQLMDQVIEMQPEAAEGFERFATMTGVNLRDDVLGTLGGTMGFYMSDATGGGSLASSVVLITFKDRARFMESHTKLVEFAHAMADQVPIGAGYIRVTNWKDGGVDLFSLRFPGLPVPFEPTWAATDRWLILGATPQAALAAARQATGKGDKGLASNPAFAALHAKDRPVISASFMDTGRMLRGGYPILSMLGSGITNAVRSPAAPERDPGMIVPTFHELARGAKATVQFTYWRGDDLVSESIGDRSVLVNVGGALGALSEIAPFIAIPMAIGAAQQNRFGMLDEDLIPRSAFAVLLNPRTPPVVRENALALLLAVAARERLTMEDQHRK